MSLYQLNSKEKKILTIIKGTPEGTLLKGVDPEGVPFLSHIFRLYSLIFGESCSSCPSKISGYIRKLKNSKSYIMKKKSEYKLRPATIIRINGKVLSEHNITDEIAASFLNKNPNRAQLFAKLPKEFQIKTKEEKDKEQLGGHTVVSNAKRKDKGMVESKEPANNLLKELLKDSRGKLNELAVESGIENPDKMNNKTEVAIAILAVSVETVADTVEGTKETVKDTASAETLGAVVISGKNFTPEEAKAKLKAIGVYVLAVKAVTLQAIVDNLNEEQKAELAK